MQPPFLMSRILTLVLASAVVVLIIMVVTLGKMFPLDRPQVFFLTTQPTADVEITLTEMPKNVEDFKKNFIMEYIKARNEIVPDMTVMQRKWSEGGIIDTLSSNKVFAEFINQNDDIWYAVLQDADNFPGVCTVEFPSEVFLPFAENTYQVKFIYTCNLGGQTRIKDYTIKLKLETGDTEKWSDRLDNPLGMRVIEYSVMDGNSDPLSELNHLDK
ncbi:MAG: hypothetical protein KBS86_00645 [Proteobacteria bacterium]|nr:hypothetical protein [Candidatus Enterousia scatequi]